MTPSLRTTCAALRRLCQLSLVISIICLAMPHAVMADASGAKKDEKECVNEDGQKVEGDCGTSNECEDCDSQCKAPPNDEPEQYPVEPDDEGSSVADPVLPGNGAFVEGGVDMTVERGGLALQASRSYISKSDAGDLGLGHKWDHTLLTHIEDLGADGVILYKGGGPKRIEFVSGEYQTDGEFDLVKVAGKFELTQPNGFKYYFDANHNIISKVSPQGPYYNWIYDGNQNVTTIQYEGATDVIYAEWDATNHRLTKLTDVHGGATVEYQYSAAGDLTKITGSCGSCSGTSPEAFGYDAAHRITAVYNADDELLHDNQYDSAARVTKQVYQASPEKGYVYDYSQFASGILTVTKPDGVQWSYHMDSSNQGTKIVVKNNGIQGGDVVTLQYFDESGNMTRHVHGNGFDQRFYYNADGRMTMAVRYDATNPLTVSQYAYDADGRATRYIDAEGIVTAYHYDDAGTGRLTKKVVDPAGLALTESWVYDLNSGLALTHTPPDGTATAFAYNASGYLTKEVVDPAGLAITTSYLVDAAGRVTKRIDPRGNAWVRLYNAAGKVTKQVSPAGRTVLRTYDNANRLITKTVQDAETTPAIVRTTTYHYDRYGNLTRKTQPAPGAGDRHTDFAYDFLERRISMTRPTGEQFAYSYNELGERYQEKVYDGTNWIVRATYLYDGDKQLTRQTDALGHVVAARAYDVYNRVTRDTDALNHYAVYEYDDMGRLTRQVRYDSADSARRESRLAYDTAGRVTSRSQLASPGGSTSVADRLVEMAYDDAGRVTQQTTYLAGSTTAVNTITYDAAGRAITRTQSDGPTVAMAYDAGGNLRTQVVDPGTGNLNLTTIFAYDSVGRQTRTTQPDLTYQVMLYDGLGRVTLTVRYDSGSPAVAFAATGRMYDDDLNMVTKSFRIDDPASGFTYSAATDPAQVMLYAATGRLTATQNPNGNTTSFAYDNRGRRITVTDPASNKQVMVYDNADRVLTRIRLDYDGVGHVTFKTAMEYDAANRATKTITQGSDGDITVTADNLAITVWYDALGQVTQTQDASGMQVASHYDALGRVTRTTEDAGVGGIARYTDRSYDRAGRLARLTGYPADATNPQHTDYAYNKAGVQTRATYPDDAVGSRGYVVFSFDAALRLTRINHQDNTNTDLVYDAMGRRLTVTKGSEIDSFTYTDWGAVASAQRGTSANPDATSKVDRLYDGLMRLTRENQSIEEDAARHVDYAYDKAGNVLTLTYPGGTVIATSYDALNRADLLKRGGSQIADYDYVGRRVNTLTYETGTNDVTLTQLYDGLGRLTRMTYAQTGNTGLPDFSYAFDDASNITRKTFEHRTGDPSEDYKYDTLYRLTKTTFGQRTSTPYEGFVYDDLGNHLTQDDNGTTTAGLFNAVNEQTQRGGTTLLWDTRGNLTKDDQGQVYFYDRQNLLTRVEKPAGTLVASYKYDALNRRIEKDVAGGDTIRFYWNGGQTIEETDAAATPDVQRTYVWGGVYIDELLQFIDSTGGTDTAYFATRHHNFNIVALLDDTGTAVERYNYNPYGQRFVLDAGFSADADGQSDLANPIGHQGLMHDEESGLVYNRGRMLHSRLGRFMQRDPLGYVDGMSLYEYVLSRPIDVLDPKGHSACIDCADSNCPAWINGGRCFGGPRGQPLPPPPPPTPPAPDDDSECEDPPCDQDWLECFNDCLARYDPLNPGASVPALGTHPWPKRWTPGRIGGRSPITTWPSIISRNLRLGPRSWLRRLGRIGGRLALPYGLYLAGVEASCAANCAADPCAY